MARKSLKEIQEIVEAMGGTDEEMAEEMARQLSMRASLNGVVLPEAEAVEEESEAVNEPTPPSLKGVKWTPFKEADGMALAWVSQTTEGVLLYMQTEVCTGSKGDTSEWREYKAEKIADALRENPLLPIKTTRDGREFVMVTSQRAGDTYSSAAVPVKLWCKGGVNARKGADPTLQLKYTLTGNLDVKAAGPGRRTEKVRKAGKR